jgi:hypothetical protein
MASLRIPQNAINRSNSHDSRCCYIPHNTEFMRFAERTQPPKARLAGMRRTNPTPTGLRGENAPNEPNGSTVDRRRCAKQTRLTTDRDRKPRERTQSPADQPARMCRTNPTEHGATGRNAPAEPNCRLPDRPECAERTQSPLDRQTRIRRTDPIAAGSTDENTPNEPNRPQTKRQESDERTQMPDDQQHRMRRTNPTAARSTGENATNEPNRRRSARRKRNERTQRLEDRDAKTRRTNPTTADVDRRAVFDETNPRSQNARQNSRPGNEMRGRSFFAKRTHESIGGTASRRGAKVEVCRSNPTTGYSRFVDFA